MSVRLSVSDLAQDVAASLLGNLGDRWSHTRNVASRAGELADRLGLEARVLVAAAWLHDIGYADAIKVSGFHSPDGADYLTAHGWPVRIAGLVAYHSGARFVADARGLSQALAVYPDEVGMLADALTYTDQTVGPTGERMTPQDRHAEMLRRHGQGSWNVKVDHLRAPHLQAVARRVETALVRCKR